MLTSDFFLRGRSCFWLNSAAVGRRCERFTTTEQEHKNDPIRFSSKNRGGTDRIHFLVKESESGRSDCGTKSDLVHIRLLNHRRKGNISSSVKESLTLSYRSWLELVYKKGHKDVRATRPPVYFRERQQRNRLMSSPFSSQIVVGRPFT